MNKNDVLLAILPTVLEKNWDGQKTNEQIALVAQDLTNDLWSVLGKMSKSSLSERG